MFLKLLALGLLLLATNTISFATCADFAGRGRSDEEVRKSLDRFEAIFQCEVIAAEPRDSHTELLHVKVLRTWKGADESEVKVIYTAGDEEYGFPNIGDQEILYAYRADDGTLLIPHCGKTYGPRDERMMSLLGTGREVSIQPTPAPVEPESFWSWLWKTIKSPFS